MEVIVTYYDPQWPHNFETIKGELSDDLLDGGVPYVSIEHIGSTSVPGLPAKPIIDVLITVEPFDFNTTTLEKFKEALSWGRRQGGYRTFSPGSVYSLITSALRSVVHASPVNDIRIFRYS